MISLASTCPPSRNFLARAETSTWRLASRAAPSARRSLRSLASAELNAAAPCWATTRMVMAAVPAPNWARMLGAQFVARLLPNWRRTFGVTTTTSECTG